MQPEIKERWITALRSGDYPQTRCQLRSEKPEYCCLGVLCDIAVQDGLGEWDGEEYVSPSGGRRTGYLPLNVLDWSGLTEDGMADLVKLNDTNGLAFDAIADYVEEQY